MTSWRFQPDTLTCPTGALVRLTFHHAGRILTARHDWVLTYPGQLEALTQGYSWTNNGVLPKDDPRVIAATPLCDKGETVMMQFVAPRPGRLSVFVFDPSGGHARDLACYEVTIPHLERRKKMKPARIPAASRDDRNCAACGIPAGGPTEITRRCEDRT